MRELLHCRGAAAVRDLAYLHPSSCNSQTPGGVRRSFAHINFRIQRKTSCFRKSCKVESWRNVKALFSFSRGTSHYSTVEESSRIGICVRTHSISKEDSHRGLCPGRVSSEGERFSFHCMVHFLAEETRILKGSTANHWNCLLEIQKISDRHEALRFCSSFRPRFCYSFSTQSKQSRLMGFSATSSLRDIPISHFSSEVGRRRGRWFRIGAQNQKRNWWEEFLFGSISLEDFPSFDNGNVDPGSGPSDEVEWEQESGGPVDEKMASDDVSDKMDEVDRMLSDDEKFFSWKRKRNTMKEPKENESRAKNDLSSNNWEDWLDDSWKDYNELHPGKDSWYQPQTEWEKGGLPRSPPKIPERGMNRTLKDLFFRFFEKQEEVEEDLAFEERVFIFTTQSAAKFVACLVLIPWFVGFMVHDYAVVPFLNRYVEKVPLAAKALDVRESQKLKMIEKLKLERQRVRLEAAIGKAPPLTDEELTEHIRDEAHKLQEEIRAENRSAFANIWSDLVAGAAFLLLLVFNPNQVAIMKLTGDRLFTNISDTGKAFIIILLSDIFLGYHSESGWETVIEIFLEHYGFEVDQASIYIFVAIVPVTIDACFKLWVFRYLTRLSASAASTFRAMKRH